jgi:ParB family chromosome partitioning protein
MIEIAIKNIIVPGNRRPIDPEKVAEIAASIKIVGLLCPIGVHQTLKEKLPDIHEPISRSAFITTLVYGAHRLEAARSLGWKKITAVDVEDIDETRDLDHSALKMMEIAENLHRADLTTQQRNDHLAEWVALLEERKPISDAEQPISSKPGRKPSPAIAAAAKMSGLTAKTVKEAIKTTVKAAADAAELSSKQRLAVARRPADQQLGAVAMMADIAKAVNKAADLAEAAAKAKPTDVPPPDVASLALSQIERLVGDLAMAVKRGDVRADAVFEGRIRAVADRLLSLIEHEPATIN